MQPFKKICNRGSIILVFFFAPMRFFSGKGREGDFDYYRYKYNYQLSLLLIDYNFNLTSI